jgi:chemotaxis protein MotB
MRRKKKSDDEHENLERWLITYSDLITLLLAFFIMMYTFSKQDAQRYEEVSENLKTIFRGSSGALSGGKGGRSVIGTLPGVIAKGGVEEQLQKELKKISGSGGYGNNIEVFRDQRGIVIRGMDKAFFDEGKANLKESAIEVLAKIGPIIRDSNNPVMIEGHTDNTPINTGEFRSNWELSVRRATEVVRYLIEEHHLAPDRISASGYAEYRPVATNDTPRNRALNRRIEIILLEKTSGVGQEKEARKIAYEPSSQATSIR